MKITVEQLSKIAGKPVNGNMRSIVDGLLTLGHGAGLDVPHRLVQYLAQVAHETMGFHYDKEVWGPTPAQQRYDTRTDLGNTAARDGDGERYKGRGPIQITGKANYQQFHDWCLTMGLRKVPYFVAYPDLVNTDPWEGIGPIWYWSTRKLNAYADKNDIEMITRRINGALNGFADRLRYYTRAGLVLLGREPDDVAGFQAWAQKQGYLPADTKDEKQVDGIDGPKTRAAIHQALVALGGQQVAEADIETKAGPVTTPVPVVPEGADKPGILRGLGGLSFVGLGTFFTGIPDPLKYAVVVFVMLLIVAMIWRGEQIAQRARKVIKELF